MENSNDNEMENFPKHHLTIDYMVKLIDTMGVDIIALQEIQSAYDFNNLISNLEGWAGGFSTDPYGFGLAFLYKSDITVNSMGEINELNNLENSNVFSDDFFRFDDGENTVFLSKINSK